MKSWHATWSSPGRHPLFPDEPHRRKAVRALVRAAGRSMSLFCLVDDHVHVVLFSDEAQKGRLTGAITHALRAVAAAPLDRPFVRAVRDRSHMDWLADTTILRQPWKHGLARHPALWTGSCFADLVGARALDGLSLRLCDALPHFLLRRAYRAVFLPEQPIAPVAPELVRAAGAGRVRSAASAALAADPDLAGNAPAEALARRATVHLLSASGTDLGEAAHALGITRTAAGRLLLRPVPLAVLLALRVRLALEDAVASALPPPSLPPDMAAEPDGLP